MTILQYFSKYYYVINYLKNNMSIIYNYSFPFFNNNFFLKYPLIKILVSIIMLNLIYRTFIYLIFLILKSVFPVFYMYYLLKQMDNSSSDKPLSNIINKINNNNSNNNENLIDKLEDQMNYELGIIKFDKSNIDQV